MRLSLYLLASIFAHRLLMNPAYNINIPACLIALFMLSASPLFAAAPSFAADGLRRIEMTDDRVFYLSTTKWHMKTRWYDAVSLPSGKFGCVNPGCNKYFELTSVDQIPPFVVIPNSHMPEVTGGPLKFARKAKFLTYDVNVLARKVNVRFRKNGAVLKVPGEEEVWVSPAIPAPPSLLKFLALYYACDVHNQKLMPIKHVLNFAGRPKGLEEHYLQAEKIENAKPFVSFGQLPKDARITNDFVQVMTGSDDSVLDFLYRGPKRGGSK